MRISTPVLVSAAVFATLLAAIAQLPIVGQILVLVFLVQVGAMIVHTFVTRRRARIIAIRKP